MMKILLSAIVLAFSITCAQAAMSLNDVSKAWRGISAQDDQNFSAQRKEAVVAKIQEMVTNPIVNNLKGDLAWQQVKAVLDNLSPNDLATVLEIMETTPEPLTTEGDLMDDLIGEAGTTGMDAPAAGTPAPKR